MKRTPMNADLYATEEKMMWRRRLWGYVAELAGGVSSVAILPGLGDYEIDVVRSLGVVEDRLHLIDHNAAIVAGHRKKRPGLGGTYGVPVARAFERMAARGVTLDAAHLDYCACISDTMLTELRHVGACPVMKHKGVIAVTALRGREVGSIKDRFDVANEYDEIAHPTRVWEEGADSSEEEWDGGPSGLQHTRRDTYRAAAIEEALNAGCGEAWYSSNGWRVYHFGAYRSGAGAQTMWWCVLARDRTYYVPRHGLQGPSYLHASEGWHWSGPTRAAYFGVRTPAPAATIEEHRNEHTRRMAWIEATGDSFPYPASLMLRRYGVSELLAIPDAEWFLLRGVGPHRLRAIKSQLEGLLAGSTT
jgi:hypothetical protein